MDLAALDHPVWRAVVGTALAYGLLLVVMTLLLFLLPYAIFAL